MKITLIEDQDYLRASVKNVLRPHAQVVPLSSYRSFRELSQGELEQTDLFIIDLDLEEELLGLKILEQLKSVNAYKIVLTGRDSQEIVREVYRQGADDYLVKPFTADTLLKVIKTVMTRQTGLRAFEKFELNEQSKTQLQAIIDCSLPVYIKGETGTGKTTIAKQIHENAGTQNGPFVAFNCSELAETLQESELFGHVKGSFTGAIKDKVGLIQLAHKGTLFLDEVATMPMSLQTKLLKVIEEKSFSPVGSEKRLESNFRLISASCEDLEQKVKSGEFREDLYFRLQGLNLRLPNLRDQKNRLRQSLEGFTSGSSRRRLIDDEAMSCLLNYNWPGNFRELQKELDILEAKNINVVSKEDLSLKIREENKSESKTCDFSTDDVLVLGLKSYIAQIEKEIVQKVLAENRGKVRKTLAQLKISSHGFYRIQQS